ncbi:MAG: IPT/TIG domain-containing protein [Candidatus Kapabacteria bacterium]|nr:IPT/TIG domain-containing protein [Candidatus Kapabacteria bacterium]
MNTCFRWLCIALFAVLSCRLPLPAQVFSAPQSLNFGNLVCTSGTVTTTIAITNTGTAAIILSGAAVSPTNADFSIVSPVNISPLNNVFIVPGATQAVVIAYNPSRIGNINAALVFASNALNAVGGINTIPLTAQRDSSGFVLSTTSIVLNNVPINTPTTTTVLLTNTGTLPLQIPTPQFSGAFALDAVNPPIVPPNGQAQLSIRFFGAPAGITTATTFTFNDQCGRVTALRAFAAVQAQPQVTSIIPQIGTAGTEVIITGRNLSNAQSVLFGGVLASSFRVVNDSQIVATVGQGSTGQVTVSVAGAIAVAPQVFTFVAQPSVLFASPLTGGAGTAVTIIGTNLASVTGVSFGGIPASFTINNASQITAFLGNGASGVITLFTPVGSTTSTQRFTFIPPPSVLFITPQSGAAGTAVTIIGNNLDSTRAVAFGGVPAQSFIQVSPTQVNAVIGTGGATGNVSITTAGGTSASQQVFTFVAPPNITFVSPNVGSVGTIVNIIGTNFTNVTGVSFGGIPAQNFVVSSPTQIIATLGNGASGAITVTTLTGSTSASQQFTFTGTPTITFFSPAQGGPGTLVNIFGTFFNGVSGVTFGGIPARSFTSLSPTQLQAVVGQGATGSIAVIAQGGVGFSTSSFGFIPTSVQMNNNAVFEAIPNPATSTAHLRYFLSAASPVKVEVFSMLGERVAVLEEGQRSSGTYTMNWSVENLPQGVYSCRLQTNQGVKTVLLRVVK